MNDSMKNPSQLGASDALPCMRREELAALAEGLVRPERRAWHPALRSARLGGRPVVWKDAGGRPWLFRRILGLVLRREARIMARLSGMPSVPRLVAVCEDGGYVMERLDADRMPHLRHSALSPAFFDELLGEIQAMHARGVAHGDLRRKNILVSAADQRPKLIDYGTAILLPAGAGWLRSYPWRQARRIDLLHYAKLKQYYLPGSLDERERRWLADAPWHYRIGGLWRERFYRPLKWRNIRKAFRKLRARLARLFGAPKRPKSD